MAGGPKCHMIYWLLSWDMGARHGLLGMEAAPGFPAQHVDIKDSLSQLQGQGWVRQEKNLCQVLWQCTLLS